MIKTICIVEPLASANYLVERLKYNGFKLVVVRLKNNQAVTESFLETMRDRIKYELWDLVLDFDILNDNLQDLIKKLKDINVEYLFYGSEYVIEFCDNLTQMLGISGNDPKTGFYRHHKYYMQEALSKAGHKTPKQILLNQELLLSKDIFNDLINQIGFPLVIKPTNSSGSIGVHVIDNNLEMDKFNIIDYLNEYTELNLQEKIIGIEYLVDTFSINGIHKISAICEYKKEIFNNNFLYRCVTYINEGTQIYQKIKNYIIKVLDAVGLKNGFGHTELFITSNGDEILIEVNPRISGLAGAINKLALSCGGKDQIDLVCDLINNKAISSHINEMHGKIVIIYNFEANKIFNAVNTSLFTNMKSYESHIVVKTPGEILTIGGDLLSSFLYVNLVNANQDELEVDYLKLLELEKLQVLAI